MLKPYWNELMDVLPNWNATVTQCNGKTESEQISIVEHELERAINKLNVLKENN